ncbi:DNA mismatch repair endonuclease MutL [bacterium]|nr:MAG: DNA mismatch repair endonuclease MutL [bacterium]
MEKNRIQVLPDEIVNRIAAGEVVERPASVVKELLENSIDAGAQNLSIRLYEAGLSRIAVEDDGCGMSRADAVLALKRHATSKIASHEDLDAIATLGFRGEALPSIASVSRVTVVTRERTAQSGTKLRVEAGVVTGCSDAGAPAGTLVEVEDIFFNTPARRKFMKSAPTELRNIIETVSNLALIHPKISFSVESEGRPLMILPPGQSLSERAEELSGVRPGGLYFAKARHGQRKLTFGFAAPHESRGHRRGIRLFVNRRAVNDRILFKALTEGYRGLLEQGRWPVALLWLDLPSDEVDVNVHPAKREVRFRDEGGLFRWVAGSVAGALSSAPWVRSGASAVEVPDSVEESPFCYEKSAPGSGRAAEALEDYARRALKPGGARSPFYSGGGYGRGGAGRAEPGKLDFSVNSIAEGAEEKSPGETCAMNSPFGELRYLGAFDATFLLFESGDRKLVIVDQHAAHERILYERISAARTGGKGQPLLVPLVVECSAAEIAGFAEREELLEAIGIRAELFGGQSLSLVEVPAGVTGAEGVGMLRDVIGGESFDSGESGGGGRADKLLARAACAGAVKAKMALDRTEVASLMRDLGETKNPSHCPHGRPLVIKMGRAQLYSLFHRK